MPHDSCDKDVAVVLARNTYQCTHVRLSNILNNVTQDCIHKLQTLCAIKLGYELRTEIPGTVASCCEV